MPELAEGARLLSEYSAYNGIEGSNPSLSAMHHAGCMACPELYVVQGARKILTFNLRPQS